MTTCPKCSRAHRGRRPLEQLIAEGSRIIALALDCTEERALAYLATQWHGGALEISGYCADCVVATLAAGRIEVTTVAHGEAVRDAEEQLAAPNAPRHMCHILPFRRPAKDAAHIGQLFDSETKKP